MGVLCNALLGRIENLNLTNTMITPDRTPVNQAARRFLSKGTGAIQTVEEALKLMGEKIASPEFAKTVRDLIEADANVRYELTIKKSNQPGFVVSLNYHAETPTKQMGTFLRLL
jgi:hypothetical protein